MPTANNNVNQIIPFYQAYLNEHPYSWELLGALNQFGIKGLLDPTDSFKRQELHYNEFGGLSPTTTVVAPHPITEFDFSYGGTYSIYNWELFFHKVTLIARRLRENNQFADSIKWLNYVFDPTEPDDVNLANQLQDRRFWQIKPFFQNVSQGSIQNMIRLLSATGLTPTEQQLRQEYETQIAAWRKNPFDPHIVAALRPRAYMLWTVMEYITTLTDWGDYLFRQDTMESINEAINLYTMAQEILGPRPKKIPRPNPLTPVSFNDIVTQLSSFSNVLVSFENRMTALNLCTCGQGDGSVDMGPNCSPHGGLTAIPEMYTTGSTYKELLFCIPNNPKLVEMWDRVEDRLFKIRHCMNIDGRLRELALFAPPIDPALLVQASAAGLSIEDAIKEATGELPHYRFSYLLQKANEFNNEVKSLGSQLLGLLEKKDAEELSLFRQVHEQNILKAARALKEMTILEAKENKSTLQKSKNLIQIRLDDYRARHYKNNREDHAMRQTKLAEGFMLAEQGIRLVAGFINQIPDAHTGSVTFAQLTGGNKISKLVNASANALSIVSTVNRNKASMSLTYAGYDRRQEEWNLQIKTASEELLQVDRQLIASDIRIALAEKELANHDMQVAQSEEMYQWLKDKYTNQKLYSWMVTQVKTVYHQMFDLAFKMAKMAQACLEYELGTSGINIIQYGQWDSSRSGLLAGERLSFQLKKLEMKYITDNKREHELSKNISLALLDPLALEELKSKGMCNIEIPEVLFDLDHSNHYFRRIKSVSISIPCIAGSNTNINAILTLNDTARRDSTSGSLSAWQTAKGENIATSSSQNDSGMFELNFRDERYVPFEGKGAVSKWTLELSNASVSRIFDFSTISDVIMHMKYTARDGGESFAATVRGQIKTKLDAILQAFGETGVHYAFSLRHDMPNEWNTFKNNGSVGITINSSRLPYFVQALGPTISCLGVVANTTLTGSGPVKVKINGNDLSLIKIDPITTTKSYQGSDEVGNLGSLVLNTSFTLAEDTLTKADIQDLVIVATIDF